MSLFIVLGTSAVFRVVVGFAAGGVARVYYMELYDIRDDPLYVSLPEKLLRMEQCGYSKKGVGINLVVKAVGDMLVMSGIPAAYRTLRDLFRWFLQGLQQGGRYLYQKICTGARMLIDWINTSLNNTVVPISNVDAGAPASFSGTAATMLGISPSAIDQLNHALDAIRNCDVLDTFYNGLTHLITSLYYVLIQLWDVICGAADVIGLASTCRDFIAGELKLYCMQVAFLIKGLRNPDQELVEHAFAERLAV